MMVDELDREILLLTIVTRREEMEANFTLMKTIRLRIASRGWRNYLTRTRPLLKEWEKLIERNTELLAANKKDLTIISGG
jgi:hypothetical protein